jgi:hypothetical protein
VIPLNGPGAMLPTASFHRAPLVNNANVLTELCYSSYPIGRAYLDTTRTYDSKPPPLHGLQ